jgi:hypothetical protein
VNIKERRFAIADKKRRRFQTAAPWLKKQRAEAPSLDILKTDER